MSTTAKRLDVLWLDDEFGTPYEPTLAPWRRVLDRRAKEEAIRLVTCGTLEGFKQRVEGRLPAHGNAEPPFRLLILDVMLNQEHQTDFALFGFPDERLVNLTAGTQIAGLIRSSRYDRQIRPAWLQSLRDTPLLLLSGSPNARSWAEEAIGPSKMRGVEVVLKALLRRNDGHAAVPEFDGAICSLCGLR